MAFSAYFIAKPELTTQDWIAFAGICSPATALFVMQVVFPDKFAYAWANWYFSFVAYLLGLAYIIMQTQLIWELQGVISNGEIRFRVNQAGNPLSPQLVSDSHLSEADADFVRSGLDALPRRYTDIMQLSHFN